MINVGLIVLIIQKSQCIHSEYCLRKDCNVSLSMQNWEQTGTEVFTKSSSPHILPPSSVGYGSNRCKPGPCGQKHPTCIICTQTTETAAARSLKGLPHYIDSDVTQPILGGETEVLLLPSLPPTCHTPKCQRVWGILVRGYASHLFCLKISWQLGMLDILVLEK